MVVHMTSYVIADAEVLDAQLAGRYRQLAESAVRLYGGRYLVLATPEVAEGEWPPSRRVIVLEFPDMNRAKEWYTSPEYMEAMEVRGTAFKKFRLLFVEGLLE
jgi:uncharacterized protein (DUF1330 family)